MYINGFHRYVLIICVPCFMPAFVSFYENHGHKQCLNIEFTPPTWIINGVCSAEVP